MRTFYYSGPKTKEAWKQSFVHTETQNSTISHRKESISNLFFIPTFKMVINLGIDD